MKHIYLALTFLLFGSTLLQAVRPETPALKYVTVNPDNNEVTISWYASTSTDVVGYVIYKLRDDGARDTVASVLANKTSYTFAPDKEEVRGYSVEAKNSLDELSVGGASHYTMMPTKAYDSCVGNILITWNRYTGWEQGVRYYQIYNYTTDELILTTQDTFYLHKDVLTNETYSYYVKAVGNELGMDSKSFRIDKYTQMEKEPRFIYSYATVSDNSVMLSFKVDSTTEIQNFRLLKSTKFSSGYQTLQNVTLQGANFYQYTDYDVKPEFYKYYYILCAINICDSIASSSDTANTMLLYAENDDFYNTLSWNDYKLSSDDYTYSLHRVSNSIDSIVVSSYDSTKYTDDVNAVRNYNMSGKISKPSTIFCYYVTTTEINPGLTSEVRSNTTCISVAPYVKMPNAFTPNGDGQHDRFYPLFDFVPETFNMIIYNRWGNKVFETQDMYTGWDGKINGSPADEGVYIYSIAYKIGKDQAEEVNYISGNVTVFYP